MQETFGLTPLSSYREEADRQMVRRPRGNIQTLVDPLVSLGDSTPVTHWGRVISTGTLHERSTSIIGESNDRLDRHDPEAPRLFLCRKKWIRVFIICRLVLNFNVFIFKVFRNPLYRPEGRTLLGPPILQRTSEVKCAVGSNA